MLKHEERQLWQWRQFDITERLLWSCSDSMYVPVSYTTKLNMIITTLQFCEISASCYGNAEDSSRLLAHGTVSQGTYFVSLWRIKGSTSSGQSNPRQSLKMKIMQDVRKTLPINMVSHPRWIKSLTTIVCDTSPSMQPCGKNKHQAYFRTSNKENFYS